MIWRKMWGCTDAAPAEGDCSERSVRRVHLAAPTSHVRGPHILQPPCTERAFHGGCERPPIVSPSYSGGDSNRAPGMADLRLPVQQLAVMRDRPRLQDQMLLVLAVRGNAQEFEDQMGSEDPLRLGNIMVDQTDDFYRRNALHLAAMHGHHGIVTRILNSPLIAPVVAQIVDARDRYGYTPLHLAVRSGCRKIVRLLTTCPWMLPDRLIGATCTGPALAENEDELHQECEDETGLKFEGLTPLHVAAVTGNIPIVQLLLRRTCQGGTGFEPVSIHATTCKGLTPLDIAKEEHHVDLVELLECFDVTWLQAERETSANSVNAILVGAALVAAVTFGCWQQPPLGIPDPTIISASPSQLTPKLRTKLAAEFFLLISLAFALSVASLVVGTLAIMPSRGVSLKVEVLHLRRLARLASIFLVMAILFLLITFHFGCVLVYESVVFAEVKWSTAVKWTIREIPIVCLLIIVVFVVSLKRVFGGMARLAVSVVVIVGVVVHMVLSTTPKCFFHGC